MMATPNCEGPGKASSWERQQLCSAHQQQSTSGKKPIFVLASTQLPRRIGQQTFCMNRTVDENAAMGSLSLLTKSNRVFACYLFWASVLVLKMLLMSLLTARQRMKSKTYANPEDVRMNKAEEVRFGDPNVERVRRAHRNDLENVLPFLVMALVYVASGPHALTAQILIRIGSCSRILHTLVYAFCPVPQPTRAIAFVLTLAITIYMAVYVICCTIKFI